jgi:hypothetical protein
MNVKQEDDDDSVMIALGVAKVLAISQHSQKQQ